jgi:hypothetical protein
LAIDAEELFVFAGAGASMSMPAGLPTFNALRDEILSQLGLTEYVAAAEGDGRGKRADVAAGLVPEPFLLEFSETGIAVQDWLRLVLSAGQPNAAHHVLAQLAMAGARVWTANFDTNIEKAADGRLGCISWPEDPAEGAPLMKPHGSIGGELIVTSKQVLAGLDPAWLQRLEPTPMAGWWFSWGTAAVISISSRPGALSSQRRPGCCGSMSGTTANR